MKRQYFGFNDTVRIDDGYWKLKYVWKHKSCLDPQIKNYGLVDFTLI